MYYQLVLPLNYDQRVPIVKRDSTKAGRWSETSMLVWYTLGDK